MRLRAQTFQDRDVLRVPFAEAATGKRNSRGSQHYRKATRE